MVFETDSGVIHHKLVISVGMAADQTNHLFKGFDTFQNKKNINVPHVPLSVWLFLLLEIVLYFNGKQQNLHTI